MVLEEVRLAGMDSKMIGEGRYVKGHFSRRPAK